MKPNPYCICEERGPVMPMSAFKTLFKPGLRLAAVASLVPAGTVVADMGTDHAYLPLYLVTAKGCPRVIGVEKSQNICARARKTVRSFGLEHRIEIRCGDGLSALQEEDGVEVVVFAGLGGKTICRLLMQGATSLHRYRRLVLQPMGDGPLLRRWLLANGFALTHGRLAREKGHFYEIMGAEQGSMTVKDPFLLGLGPELLAEPDPLLVPWLEDKIRKCEQVLTTLGKGKDPKLEGRRRYFQERLEKLKELLQNAGFRK